MGNNEQTHLFLEKISNNKGIIHKVCNIYCNTAEDKQDMMQEITLQLWKSFPSFKGKSKFSSWMYQVAINTAITDIRKSKKSLIVEALSEKEPKLPEKEDIPDLDESVNKLYKAIAKLNDIEKAIILLYLEKKTYLEIGEIVGIGEKNVSVKIVRIKRKIKELMS